MNEQKPGMFIPALIGGGIAGLLAGIPLVSCLCCLWVIGGGIIAVYFLSKDSSVALGPGDGAIVGVFSGIIAAVVELLISIPLAPLENKLFKIHGQKTLLDNYGNAKETEIEKCYEKRNWDIGYSIYKGALL